MTLKDRNKACSKDIDLDDCGGAFADKIDLLFEKRCSVREGALRDLNIMLSLRYCGPHLLRRIETLVDGLQKVLKCGGEDELLLAYQTISLTSISLVMSRDLFFRKFKAPLLKVIEDETTDVTPAVREKAVDTFSILAILHAALESDHSSDDVITWILEKFQTLLQSYRQDVKLVCALLNGWALLLTCLPDQSIRSIFEIYGDTAQEYLSDGYEASVRMSAAKLVTIFVEAMRHHAKSIEEGDPDADMHEDKMGPDTNTGSEIVARFNDILDDKSKFKSQADRQKQRKLLRELVAYIENAAEPNWTVMIRDHMLCLHRWSNICRMETLRSYTGEGYMTHLQENPNFMHMFDYYVDITEDLIPTMTKKERRLSLGEIAKHNQKRRNSEREYRAAGYATD